MSITYVRVVIHKATVKQVPALLQEILRHCCPIKIFILVFIKD